MKHVGLTILIYTALVLQSGVGESLAIGIARPAFLSIAWAVVLLTTSGRSCLLWAGLIGLLDDCLTDQPLGIAMIVFVLMAAVAQRFFHPRSERSAAATPVILLMTIFSMLALCITARTLMAGGSVDISTVLMTDAAIAAYSTAVVTGGLIVWHLVRRVIPSRPGSASDHRTNRFRLLTK